MNASSLKYVPELMDSDKQKAIMAAMNELYSSDLLLQQIWPGAYDFKRRTKSDIQPSDVDVIVLPLDRIGAPSGHSGSSVFIVYFSTEKEEITASPPLVVKIGCIETLTPEIDVNNHWPTLSNDTKSHFALPIHLYKKNSESVLIAPFSSESYFNNNENRHGFYFKDLWTLLHQKKGPSTDSQAQDWAKIQQYIEKALDSINYVHRNNLRSYTRKESTYAEAYDWYLRDTTKDKHRHIPNDIFGDNTRVAVYGKTWPNPKYIIDQLINSDTKFTGVFGPVHGDFHPKNIVIGHNDFVSIIDFGWARENIHIIVDYVLLDINIRSITLPSQISELDVLDMAQFLSNDADTSKFSETIKPRAKIIKDIIWSRCHSNLIQDWRKEYIIPFFLVSYGLLVHLDKVRNQSALLASVLASAELIENNIQ